MVVNTSAPRRWPARLRLAEFLDKVNDSDKAPQSTNPNTSAKRELSPDLSEVQEIKVVPQLPQPVPPPKRARLSTPKDPVIEHLETKLKLERSEKEKERVTRRLRDNELKEVRAKLKVQETEVKRLKSQIAHSSKVTRLDVSDDSDIKPISLRARNEARRIRSLVDAERENLKLQQENRGLEAKVKVLGDEAVRSQNELKALKELKTALQQLVKLHDL